MTARADPIRAPHGLGHRLCAATPVTGDSVNIAAPYLRKIEIDNLRPIRKLVWELPDGVEPAGWHVIIGDNGAGKTSFLEAVALAMLGGDATLSLQLDPGSYVRRDTRGTSGCALAMVDGPARRWDANRPLHDASRSRGTPPLAGYHASFGAVRRFLGGYHSRRLELADPPTARHASLFDPGWALGDLVQWLKDLRLDAIGGEHGPTTLSWVMRFINQEGLLPEMRLVNVTSEGARFLDANGHEVGMEALSDGYQSAVGLTLEILRQLCAGWPVVDVLAPDGDDVVVNVPGVVLIDEVDAHLHPTWQQRIGFFFRKHFPRIQFLVTTHSPLACRAAEQGTIFRLPRPGQDEPGQMLTGQTRDRLLFGDVLDAYGTEVFGPGVTRGARGQQKFDRLAKLNVKARFGVPLAREEEQERQQLQELLLEDPRP